MRHAIVSGPRSGARAPYGLPRRDLADVGYVCEEFILEGTAVAYTYVGEGQPSRDGRWESVAAGDSDYRTRILVIRPREAADFNGTVLLRWLNVSAGYEIERPDEDEIYRGYAWVGVSAQEFSLDGGPYGAQSSKREALGLVEFDPERYSTLHHPGDVGSFEIFGQAAHAVGPLRLAGGGDAPDPLGGLEVRRVLATGGSQSAMRLVAYCNGVHQHHHAIDGFLLSVWEGRMPRLDEGPVPSGMSGRLRDDLDVPVLIVNSEAESASGATLLMPDSDRLRVWEVTGTAHGHWYKKPPISERGWGPNPLSWGVVEQAATRALHDWVRTGTPAPGQPRIAIEGDGSSRLKRDQRRIAVGGVRLPEIAVPMAEYRGMSLKTGIGPVFGGYRPFSPAELSALYPTPEGFLSAWDVAVHDLVDQQTLLPEDAPGLLARGRELVQQLAIR